MVLVRVLLASVNEFGSFFSSFAFFWWGVSLGRIGTNCLLNVWWNSPVKPSSSGFVFLLGGFDYWFDILIGIDQFKFTISSLLCLGRLYVSRNEIFTYLFNYEIYWCIIVHYNLLWSHAFFVVSIVISTLSLQILFTQVLSPFFFFLFIYLFFSPTKSW